MPRGQTGIPPRIPPPPAGTSLCLASIPYSPARRGTASSQRMATAMPNQLLQDTYLQLLTESLAKQVPASRQPNPSSVAYLHRLPFVSFPGLARLMEWLGVRSSHTHPSPCHTEADERGWLLAEFRPAGSQLNPRASANEIYGRIRRTGLA